MIRKTIKKLMIIHVNIKTTTCKCNYAIIHAPRGEDKEKLFLSKKMELEMVRQKKYKQKLNASSCRKQTGLGRSEKTVIHTEYGYYVFFW